jgi:hypothetical protein
VSLVRSDLKHHNTYVYYQADRNNWRLFTGAVLDDFSRADGFKVRAFSPKVGLQYAASGWNVRTAWYRGIKGSAAKEQTLEPTQFAQFNQLFDDTDGTRYERSALAVDYVWGKSVQTGLELSRRDLEVYGLGCKNGNCTGAWTERAHRAYWAWRLEPRWALNVSLLYDSVRLGKVDDFNYPVAAVTRQLPITLNYFASENWKLGLEWRGVEQSVENRNLGVTTATRSNFSLVNFSLRYGHPQRSWSLALEINNVFDKAFRFQNTSLNDEPRVPLFQPGRSIYVRASLKM